MEDSMKFGLVTVFAVSGSMVLLVHQVHKHMLKNFMNKFEFEIRGVVYPHDQKSLDGSKKHRAKKKVRFAKDVLKFPMENKSDHVSVATAQLEKGVKKWRSEQKSGDIMPPNWEVMYRGILKYRSLKLLGET